MISTLHDTWRILHLFGKNVSRCQVVLSAHGQRVAPPPGSVLTLDVQESALMPCLELIAAPIPWENYGKLQGTGKIVPAVPQEAQVAWEVTVPKSPKAEAGKETVVSPVASGCR